jgi:hypothetical protein
MVSVTAVLGSHEFTLRILLATQGGTPIIGGREEIAGGSAVLLTLSEGLEIEICDFELANAMQKGDYLGQVVQIVIGGVPTVLEIRFMCFLVCLGKILL